MEEIDLLACACASMLLKSTMDINTDPFVQEQFGDVIDRIVESLDYMVATGVMMPSLDEDLREANKIIEYVALVKSASCHLN